MSDNLRWTNEDKLPEHVRAAMRDMVPECLREAARKEDPGDGYMCFLAPERNIDGGMYDGGWKLQSSIVQDARFHPCPYVVVHAYHGSQVSWGSVAADVVRTAQDRRFLAQQRLDALRKRRADLDADIARLRAALEPEEGGRG